MVKILKSPSFEQDLNKWFESRLFEFLDGNVLFMNDHGSYRG